MIRHVLNLGDDGNKINEYRQKTMNSVFDLDQQTIDISKFFAINGISKRRHHSTVNNFTLYNENTKKEPYHMNILVVLSTLLLGGKSQKDALIDHIDFGETHLNHLFDRE